MDPCKFEAWSGFEAHDLSEFFSCRTPLAFRLIGDVLHLFFSNPKSLSPDSTPPTFGGKSLRSKTSDRVLILLSFIQLSFLCSLCFHVFYFLTHFRLFVFPLLLLSFSVIFSWMGIILKLYRRNSSCILWTIALIVGPQRDRSILFLFRLFFRLVCDYFCCSFRCMTPFWSDFERFIIKILFYFWLSCHLWLDSYFIALVVFWWLVSSLAFLYDAFSSLFFFLLFFLFFFFFLIFLFFFPLLFFLFMLFLTFFNAFSRPVSLVIRSIKTLPQRCSQDWLKVSEISWNTIWRIFDFPLNQNSHTFPSCLPYFTSSLIHLSKIVSLSWSFGRFTHIRRWKFIVVIQLLRFKHFLNIRQLWTLLFGLSCSSLLSFPPLFLLLQLKFQLPFFHLFFLSLAWCL